MSELVGSAASAELTLENDGLGVAEVAAPACVGGVALGKETVSGGADLGDVIDVGVLREREAEAGE